MRFILGLTAVGFLWASGAQAQLRDHPTPSGLEVPRFVSLKNDKVNGRKGPSLQHPIRWVYKRKGLPVKITAETDNWRRIQDPVGDTVWVHRSMVSGRRTAMVQDEPAGGLQVRRKPSQSAGAVASLAKGVVVIIKTCEDNWCQIEVGRKKGWIQAKGLWGLMPHEPKDWQSKR